MERVNIILPTRPKADISGKDWILFDKEQFRNMVFQAYYYPNTSLTINNVTVANRDVKIAICGKVIITDCDAPHFAANVFLDRLWYRFVNNEQKIFISASWRDYLTIMREEGFVCCHQSNDGLKDKTVWTLKMN